jgi:tetratricopeptide (TPR) repeat protein
MTSGVNDREARLLEDTKDILAQLPSPVVLAVYRSAVLHWFNLEFLRSLQGGPLPGELPGEKLEKDGLAIDQVYEALVTLPFVEPYGARLSAQPYRSSYALHELTRKAILEFLWTHENEFVRNFSGEAAELFQDLQTADNNDAFIYTLEWLYHLLLVDEQKAFSELQERITQVGRKGQFGQLHSLARIPREHASAGRLSSSGAQWADVLHARSLVLAGKTEAAEEILQRVRDRDDRRLATLGSARVEATLLLADIRADTGQYLDAKELYEEAAHEISADPEESVERAVGALAGGARMCLAQDLLIEAREQYSNCMNLYLPTIPGKGLLFQRADPEPGIVERAVASIRQFITPASDFPNVVNGQDPDQWILVGGLLYAHAGPLPGPDSRRFALYREVRPSTLLVDLWAQLSELYGRMADHGKMKQAARLARVAAQALGDPWATAVVGVMFVRLGIATEEADLRESGVQLLLSVLEVAHREADKSLELGAQLSIAEARLAANDNQSAADYFGNALELALILGNLRSEATALTGLGRVTSRAGRDARPKFNGAIDLYRKLNNSESVANVQCELAKQAIREKRWQEAQDLLVQSLEENRRNGRLSDRTRVLSLMATVAAERGDPVEAKRRSEEVIALGAKARMPYVQIAGQTSLARIHLSFRRTEEARDLYGQALALAEEGDLEASRAEVLMGQGLVDYETDSRESAESAKEKFDQAFEISCNTGDLRRQAEARIGQANVERHLGDPGRASELSREAVDLAARSGDKNLRIAAERAYGVSLGEAGRAEEALERFRKQFQESPEDASIQGCLGWSLYVLGRYEESLRASTAAHSRDPSLTWILRNIGLTHLANGDPAEARQAYLDALQKTRLGDSLADSIRDVTRLRDKRPDMQGADDILTLLLHWRPNEEGTSWL